MVNTPKLMREIAGRNLVQKSRVVPSSSAFSAIHKRDEDRMSAKIIPSKERTDEEVEKDTRKKKQPTCARCRNHGKKSVLAGHKRHCFWKNCECIKCLKTVGKQKAMKDNVALKRFQEEEAKRRGPAPVLPKPKVYRIKRNDLSKDKIKKVLEIKVKLEEEEIKLGNKARRSTKAKEFRAEIENLMINCGLLPDEMLDLIKYGFIGSNDGNIASCVIKLKQSKGSSERFLHSMDTLLVSELEAEAAYSPEVDRNECSGTSKGQQDSEIDKPEEKPLDLSQKAKPLFPPVPFRPYSHLIKHILTPKAEDRRESKEIPVDLKWGGNKAPKVEADRCPKMFISAQELEPLPSRSASISLVSWDIEESKAAGVRKRSFDDEVSGDEEADGGVDDGKPRAPKCSRCGNHDVVTHVKGHKGNCIFGDCECGSCQIVANRQRANKAMNNVSVEKGTKESGRRGIETRGLYRAAEATAEDNLTREIGPEIKFSEWTEIEAVIQKEISREKVAQTRGEAYALYATALLNEECKESLADFVNNLTKMCDRFRSNKRMEPRLLFPYSVTLNYPSRRGLHMDGRGKTNPPETISTLSVEYTAREQMSRVGLVTNYPTNVMHCTYLPVDQLNPYL